MDDIIVKTALVARTYLYRVFQAVFGDDPTEEVLAALFSDTTDQAVECFEAGDSTEFAKALALFAACRKGYAEDPAGYLEAAQRDYMHVLVGPEDLKAPPWECVYLTNERVLFQEATLKVREAYRSENMLPSQYPRVSDDHLAIELDFMVKLSEKTQKAFDEGDANEYRRLLSVQRSFLTDHPLAWVANYASDLSDAAPGSLYEGVGALCSAFLPIDVDVIGEVLEEGERS